MRFAGSEKTQHASSFYPKKMQRLEGDPARIRAIRAGGLLAPCAAVRREGTMRLVADRFVIDDARHDGAGGCAIDLATGRSVQLILAPAGTLAEQRAWLVGADECLRERRHDRASLVDYGLLGAGQRFEAWSTGQRIPSGDATCARSDAQDPSALAVVIVERPSVTAIAEMCQLADERRPRIAALWGPPGSGRSTVVECLARAARSNGLVPVHAAVLQTYQDLVARRTLFIVDTRPDPRPETWMRALLRSPRAHVCVFVGSEPPVGMDAVALERLTAEELAGAVRPQSLAPELAKRVRRAAERADGLPGRFVRALWPREALEDSPRGQECSRVAEQAAVYGEDGATVAAWPVPGEVVSLGARVTSAETLLDAGRYAAAIRLLRQAVSGLARRYAWPEATAGAATLAAALLRRGRARDALRALDSAREYAARTDTQDRLIDIAVLTGSAWIDLGKLDDAERVLTGALTSARACRDHERSTAAATSLARCLFWRGAYAEAIQLLDPPPRDATQAVRVRRLRTLARARVAQGASAQAVAALDEARELVVAAAAPELEADILCSSATIKLAVGDLDGLDRDVSACLAAARAARHPMRAVRARVLQAEADRRRGRVPRADEIVTLRRLASAAPPLVRLRHDLVRTLRDSRPDVGLVERYAARVGLKGLELFGGLIPRSVSASATDPFVDDIVAILHVCQHADDETAVLKEVCVRVRRQLYASTTAFVIAGERRLDTLIADGPRMETDVAQRAIESGLTIAPHRVHERLEAAAPVLYGGAAIGSLCARWTLGNSHDLSRVGAVLAMAATAAAPLLSAVLARRSQPAPSATQTLLGVTSAVASLRESVERAAVAPFSVLIEGESGSGKELVARAIHRCGPRRDRPFCTLNCAALPDDLVEAELFGHARGSFTGAVVDRPGVFEEAHHGTLFLDEIGELSLRAQAKLLRVIQEGELRRIGENAPRRVDVRIVCATNRNLRTEVEAGRFRLDLLYRLDVIRIVVPALRERREDVPVLVDHFWADATRRLSSRATLATATRSVLASYDWPGNVRELQNVLAALAVRCPRRGVIPPSALPPHLGATQRVGVWRLDAARRSFEEGFVRAALVRTGGRRGRAAAELGVTRQGLTKLLARLGIE
jgi:DNA-binding NtrC family response regulator/tetratricopeptide (TPR) repeat protein